MTQAASNSPTRLTDLEWAVICAIHIEPDYRFQYSEAAAARRMEKKGLLKAAGGKRYTVTARGESLYRPTL